MMAVDDVSSLLFSTDPTLLEPFVGQVRIDTRNAVHGRGIVATKDISPGECLFMIAPTVCAAIADIRRLLPSNKSLESIAEVILLKNMKRSLRNANTSVAASFMFLTNGKDDKFAPVNDEDAMSVLLGNRSERWWKEGVDDNQLLDIIRHNAFGPEFHNYSQMSENISNFSAYARILGIYPLAAMLNHSCQPNAVRIFSGETMIVRACAEIKKDEEIVWSYIPPSNPRSIRQEQLQGKFHFTCACQRCEAESKMPSKVLAYEAALSEINVSNKLLNDIQLGIVNDFESSMKDTKLSNELRLYQRVAHLHVYLNLINTLLMSKSPDKVRVMLAATELHLALSVYNNSCTEHLSILHLCYELSVGATSKSKFWTDQLRRAHAVRYGKLGNNLESVRGVLQHTRGILRTQGGMVTRKWPFL